MVLSSVATRELVHASPSTDLPSSWSEQDKASAGYRSDIDGLRALAVAAVVCFHAFPGQIPGGFVGVDIFFVISGFLISTILLNDLKRGSFSFFEFYSRRIRRIFPALTIVLAFCFAFSWFALFPDEFSQLGKHLGGGAGFVSNFVLWSETGYFDNSAATKPLLHLWSLGVEEQFYIAWPLVLWAAWYKRANLLAVTLGIASVSFLYNIHEARTDAFAAFYSPLARCWELMAGAGLTFFAVVKNRHLAHLRERLSSPALTNFWSACGLLLILASCLFLSSARHFPGLMPTVGAVLIIFSGRRSWVNRFLLSSPALVWIGLISYPIYLWHWPLFSFARIIEGSEPAIGVRVTLVFASVILGWVTYRFVEQPIRRIPTRGTVLALCCAMAAIGLSGLYVFHENGLPERAMMKDTERVISLFEGPHWQYTNNETCLKRYPFEESKSYGVWFCMASKDQPPTILLLGNSYANHLYPGFAKTEGLSGNSVLSIGTCEPDERLTNNPESPSDPCFGTRQLHQQALIDNIIETSGSLRYVIFDSLRGAPDPVYVAGIRRRVDLIERHGIRVIFFVPHLTLGYDIRSCFARPFKRALRDCKIPPGARDNLNKNFALLTSEILKTNPRVLVFDQNSAFCSSDGCSMLKDGLPVLRDEAYHYSEYGSLELGKVFEQWAARQGLNFSVP